MPGSPLHLYVSTLDVWSMTGVPYWIIPCRCLYNQLFLVQFLCGAMQRPIIYSASDFIGHGRVFVLSGRAQIAANAFQLMAKLA